MYTQRLNGIGKVRVESVWGEVFARNSANVGDRLLVLGAI